MKKILFLSLGLFLMVACGSNDNNADSITEKDELIDSISAIEHAVGNPNMLFSGDTAEMMVKMYTRFVNDFPEDSLTPYYMMRTAEIEVNRGNFDKGIAIFDTILEKYTPGGFDSYADCMYRKALILDQDGEHCEQAIAAYGAFVETFPDHYLATEAKNNMKIAEKSQKELLETVHNWEKKRK